MKLLKQELKKTQDLEERVFAEIKSYIEEHPNLKDDFRRLRGISGIGEKAAFGLLTLFHTYQGTNRAQISKNDNRHIRKLLYMPTLCAIKNNQKINIFYNRLIEHHKPKKVAVIACMRKLLLVAHAIYWNQTEYVAI